MIAARAGLRVWVATQPVDFRRGVNGLAALVAQTLGARPASSRDVSSSRSMRRKSAVARPWQRSFLGFTVTDEPQPRRRIADKAVARFKDRVRDLTRRHRGVSLERMVPT